MQRFLIWSTRVVCPAVIVAVMLGCGGKADDDDEKDQKSNKPKETKAGASLLEASYTGTLTGKVTVEGTPDIAKLNESIQAQMKAKDQAHCLAADAKPEEKEQFLWRIGKDGGL